MNRLQKKCVIATAGIHLLLLTILFVGPAFFNPKPKVDNTAILDVIPANLVDAAFNSGVHNATPPPPTPVVTPPPQAVTPTPPTPQVQPVTPPPAPKVDVTPPPTLTERFEKFFKSEPAKPEPEKTVTKTHQIQVNTQLVARASERNSTKPVHSQREARALNNALKNLKENLSPGTTIEMPGNSTAAYANYASAVKSVYDQAWVLPAAVKDENITVSVTIARDGTVLTSRIVTRSGDTAADESVQRTLDHVTYIAPFPEGTTDKQRTYTIVFNPQIKNSE